MVVKTDSINSRWDMLNSLKNRFQRNSTTQKWTNTNPISSNNSIWDIINSETDTARNIRLEKAMNLLKNKHDVRLKMAAWEMSSGNKNADKLENARSSLADYARAAYMEEAKNDRSMDLSVLDKMKDQDIIDWMTKDDPDAEQAYIDFVNKGGFVKDVYNKIMWIDEEAIKQAEREESWVVKNFLGSAAWFIGNQIAWASDLLWITDWANEREKKRLQPYLNVSTDEYEKLKSWQISEDELKEKWLLWVYNDYEYDTENWNFMGSIEDYWKAMYDKGIWRTEQTAQEQAATDLLDSIWYNPEWEWANAWKKTAEFAEFLTMPNSKLGWLKNTLLWTAEIMWLDALTKWKDNTLWDFAEDTAWTAATTSVIEWVLHTPWALKWAKNLLWKTTPEVKQSLEKTTMDQWKLANKTADKWLNATKKQATKYIDKAAKWISDRLSGIWENLWKSREKLANIGKDKFSYNDLFGSINDSFRTLEEKWWGKNSAPEIKVDKAGNMSIYNEDALSSATDSEWTKILDYIKNEWNAFKNQWRNENAQSVERLMQDIKWKIDNAVAAGKINRWDNALIMIKEWINKAYDKLYKVADEVEKWLWKEFKEQRKQFNRTKSYETFFDKYIGSIRGWKWWDRLMGELKNLEKDAEWGEKGVKKWEDVIWRFFDILRKDKVVKEDLWSQLVSLIYAFSLKNKGQLKDLIETIYPSIPWIEQAGLDVLRRKARGSAAKWIIKEWAKKKAKQEANNAAYKLKKSGYEPTIWDNISEDIKWVGRTIKSWIKKSPRAWAYMGIEEIND